METDLMRLLVWLIEKHVPKEMRDLLFDPQYHNPTWHEHSLMLHNAVVLEAAHGLHRLTGINVLTEAYVHDVGKISQFVQVVENGNHRFIGHEKLSAEIARDACLSKKSQFLIRHHDISYNHRPDKVIKKLCGGDQDLLQHLLVLAAADTAGKGWTDAQKEQRPQVADKFETICTLTDLPSEFSRILTKTILEW